MIFPLGIRGYCNRKQPAKCHLTDNETVPIKKWCKLVRAIKAKRCHMGVKQGLGVEFWNVFSSASALNITAFCEEQKLCMYMVSSYGYRCGSFIALCADAVMPICFAN